jgi:pimeloyl-ACP methyl ester carboxylesterase
LFSQMRSGAGFLNDLVEAPDVTEQITQPALIIASRKDGAVSFAHARTLADGIACARLIESNSDSHFIWFGPDYPAIAATIRGFLASEPGDP